MQPSTRNHSLLMFQSSFIGAAGFAVAMACTTASAIAADVAPLEKYKIDATQVSVSGISSGGAMATQLHVAYSSVFKKGVGLVAAPPYYCARGSAITGLRCVKASETAKPPTEELIGNADSWSGKSIDAVSNLSDTRVYVFSGALDSKVSRVGVQEAVNFYKHYASSANVVYKNDVEAEHAWVTDFHGAACSEFSAPYINNCKFDLAGEILKWIHGSLKPRTSAVAANLVQFDQNEFRPDETRDRDGFDEAGWVYVPSACKKAATCKIHVALHGCMQGQSYVADNFAKYSGYNEWAESNNMIVLYPQAVPSGTAKTRSFNPLGCWDWWGYSATDAESYAHKDGIQPSAIKKMIDRLKGGV